MVGRAVCGDLLLGAQRDLSLEPGGHRRDQAALAFAGYEVPGFLDRNECRGLGRDRVDSMTMPVDALGLGETSAENALFVYID